MSRIANPLYDTTFKYLMEDEEIAEGFISAILNKKIIKLDFKTGSSLRKVHTAEQPKDKLVLYHLDFKATVADADENGNIINTQEVLIELQKGYNIPDIYRFRDYLASELSVDKIENKKMKKVIVNDEIKNIEKIDKDYDITKPVLPIINIYILGFSLVDKEFLIRKPGYYLNSEGKIIHPKDPFVYQVSLDPVIIQVPNIPSEPSNALEEIMSLFVQTFIEDESSWVVDFKKGKNIKNATLDKMEKKLIYLLADEEARKDLKAERDGRLLMDQIQHEEEKLKAIVNAQNLIIEDKDKALEDKDKVLEDKDKALEDKDKALEDKDKALEDKEKRIAEMQAFIDNIKNNK